MTLKGLNFIGATPSGKGRQTFQAANPATGAYLLPDFVEATPEEVDAAVQKAAAAFAEYRLKSGAEKALFLDAIAEEILALGPDLIGRCCAETGLPEARITGERGRTTGQLQLFARLLREGSWVDARIDTAQPDRQPLPRPDIRSMQRALGPVAVFGASNFPLAFSVAGGDTASALAAGCPVVVKAHPSHPGTCELIARAILAAAQKAGMPDGVFSMVHGTATAVGLGLVSHPLLRAVGFTGSFRGGKALFDAAAQRPSPIPVYAEMGSVNPVFILPEALKERGETIANGLAASVTLGVGQFCTNPGVVVLQDTGEAAAFRQALAGAIGAVPAGVMLNTGIHRSYEQGMETLSRQPGVRIVTEGQAAEGPNRAIPRLLGAAAADFIQNTRLEEEVFGPCTLAVLARDKTELLALANNLSGHLTASVFGTAADFAAYGELLAVLEQKAGRLILNGYPTGVEVCPAMVHGGPFPATTDSRSTSVGTAAILRFSRPVCYQNFPEELLPAELQNGNPLGIRRLVDGDWENPGK